MDNNKILSFEEFVQNGSGEMNQTAEMPKEITGEEPLGLPAPEETPETGETEHNVPNNMIEDEPTEDEAPEASVEIEGSDEIESHID